MQTFDDGGPQCSRLTFLTYSQSTDAVDLFKLQRVRKVVTRSQSGVHGKIADVALHRSRHGESQNELRGIRVMLATSMVDSLQEQPFLLEYHSAGKKHRYTPDLLAVWKNFREAIEIKEDSEADKPDSQEQVALIEKLLREYGFHFRVWRRSEICAEPRLSNAILMLRYRRVEVSPMEHEQIRQSFCALSQVALRQFHDNKSVAVQSVLRLVLAGELHIDWWKPLTLDSTVSVVPIGRQVWPRPPMCYSIEEGCDATIYDQARPAS